MSTSTEDYLKAILELGEAGIRVTTSSLAERLGVAAPSVTGMIKRLSQDTPPLLDYEPHHGVKLTRFGRLRALRVLRRHRLVETFLVEALGYTWDEVHEDAEQLEHHISDRLEERIAAFLNHPCFDPHGDPIPAVDGSLPRAAQISLLEVAPGAKVSVARVRQTASDMLRHLDSLGLHPGVAVSVTRRDPFDGPVHIAVEGKNEPVIIGAALADSILVQPRQ